MEDGGAEIDFVAPKSELEEEFKNTLAIFKSKKAAFTARVEAEKEENLLQKQHGQQYCQYLIFQASAPCPASTFFGFFHLFKITISSHLKFIGSGFVANDYTFGVKLQRCNGP